MSDVSDISMVRTEAGAVFGRGGISSMVLARRILCHRQVKVKEGSIFWGTDSYVRRRQKIALPS